VDCASASAIIMKMSVLLVSFSFSRGGAAIAARKFARLAQYFSDVRCFCAEPSSGEDDLRILEPSRLEFIFHKIKRIISYALLKLMTDGNPVKHSLNLFSSRNVLNGIKVAQSFDTVLHLHWVNNDTLSIFHLYKLPSGSVITLHDEWFYCGAEHYYPGESKNKKFIDGYSYRDPDVSGINWNRLVWKIKLSQLRTRKDLIFTVPSRWMLDRAKESAILRDKNIQLLPNPIETDQFKPLEVDERSILRIKHGIGENDIVFTVGAVKGADNPMKGFDVFINALALLRPRLGVDMLDSIHFVMFGGCGDDREEYCGFSVVNLGRVSGTSEMRKVYGIADCTIVPSIVESFGQVAAESLACQTPVVAFKTSGIMDIVQHGRSGYLAEPYNPESLADCLYMMIYLTSLERSALGLFGRSYVKAQFSFPVVGEIYRRVIDDALKAGHHHCPV